MSLEYIEIRGARENNLKDISLRIPKRQITIFTGISGSGKSSLVFDTIASEARRQLNETFSTFVRNFLPRYAQPEADAIENLSMAIVVDQNRLGGGSHSTVGTVTDIFSVMRLLFSRIGKPYVGPAIAFSFNDPRGMCQECNGVGRKIGIDLDKFIDTSKSLNEGAILYPEYAVDSWGWNILKQSGLFDFNKKLDVYSDEEMDYLLHSKPSKVKIQMGNKPVNITFEGIVDKFTRKYIQYDLKTYSERTQKSVQQYMRDGPCPSCKGTRLNQAVLNCKIKGYNIAQLADMEVDDLLTFMRTIDDPVAAPIVKNITDRLQNVIDIGLEYLNLNRQTDTLSGGESQRIKMVKHLGSSLADMMYIFDEPSIGLHPRDVHRLNDLMKKLHDKGNTVLVVEHDPDVLRVADYIVDLGPRAGQDGGRIVFEGNWEALLRADTLTGKYTKETVPIKEKFRTPTGTLSITNATANNLQNVSVAIPLGVLTVITGVAGSGKSSLIHQSFVPENPGAIVIDQSPVGVSSRSNAATYTGIMDNIRAAFAKANQVNSSLFSFNSKGACENCGGLGVVYYELSYFDEVKTPCEVCGGNRFKDEVLAYKYNGKSISEVLNMSVEEALAFFESNEICRILQTLYDVGLNYLTLGQPLSTLSGGECQRIKIASELHKNGNIYILDEPTTGLHMSDINNLLRIINRLVDEGNTVIIIEHNQTIIKNADWIIDMGPEGGNKGGRIIFEGTPAQLIEAPQSLTGAYLKS